MGDRWASTDREAFATHLEQEGLDEAEVRGLVAGARRVVDAADGASILPKHVDLAVRQASERGATGTQLAWIQRGGERLVRFVRPSRPPVDRARPSGHALPLPEELPLPAAPSASSRGSIGRCTHCGGELNLVERSDTQSKVGGAMGIGGAIGGFILMRLLGCFGSIAFWSALASLALVWGAITAHFACILCHQKAARRELDESQSTVLQSAFRKRMVGALGTGAFAVVMFMMWMGAAVALTTPESADSSAPEAIALQAGEAIGEGDFAAYRRLTENPNADLLQEAGARPQPGSYARLMLDEGEASLREEFDLAVARRASSPASATAQLVGDGMWLVELRDEHGTPTGIVPMVVTTPDGLRVIGFDGLEAP